MQFAKLLFQTLFINVCMNIITSKIKIYLLKIPHIVYINKVICYYLYYITTIVDVNCCFWARGLTMHSMFLLLQLNGQLKVLIMISIKLIMDSLNKSPAYDTNAHLSGGPSFYLKCLVNRKHNSKTIAFRVMPLILQLHLHMINMFSKFGVDICNTF